MSAIATALPERCVSFVLNGEPYGVDVLRVREVLQLPPLTTVPGAGVLCVGVLNLRGRIVTVLDLYRLLALPGQADQDAQHLLVVEKDKRLLGLLVDNVGEVLRLGSEAREEAGEGQGVMTMVHHQDRFIAVLDLDRVLEGAE